MSKAKVSPALYLDSPGSGPSGLSDAMLWCAPFQSAPPPLVPRIPHGRGRGSRSITPRSDGPRQSTTLGRVTSIPFGVFGLAVMGQNLARNVASRGVSVAVYNRTAARTRRMMAEHGAEGSFVPGFDVASFVASIERPRTILIMVKA